MDDMWITSQPDFVARLAREKLDLLLGVGEAYGESRVLDVIASPAAVTDFEVKAMATAAVLRSTGHPRIGLYIDELRGMFRSNGGELSPDREEERIAALVEEFEAGWESADARYTLSLSCWPGWLRPSCARTPCGSSAMADSSGPRTTARSRRLFRPR